MPCSRQYQVWAHANACVAVININTLPYRALPHNLCACRFNVENTDHINSSIQPHSNVGADGSKSSQRGQGTEIEGSDSSRTCLADMERKAGISGYLQVLYRTLSPLSFLHAELCCK